METSYVDGRDLLFSMDGFYVFGTPLLQPQSLPNVTLVSNLIRTLGDAYYGAISD